MFSICDCGGHIRPELKYHATSTELFQVNIKTAVDNIYVNEVDCVLNKTIHKKQVDALISLLIPQRFISLSHALVMEV